MNKTEKTNLNIFRNNQIISIEFSIKILIRNLKQLQKQLWKKFMNVYNYTIVISFNDNFSLIINLNIINELFLVNFIDLYTKFMIIII